MKKRFLFMIILVLCVLLTACGEQKAYDEACALFESGRYVEAIEMFRALGRYSDSSDRAKIAQTRLEQTSAWHDGDAAENERALKYADAFTFLELGRTQDACETFASLGSYRDAEQRLAHFTVLRGALIGEEVRHISGEEDVLRGSASYTYGADGLAVSRSGFCKLDKYGWFEDFNYHYGYDGAGRLARIDAVNASGTLSFSIEYGYDENGRQVSERYADSYGKTREFTREYVFVDATDSTDSYTEITEYEIFNGSAYPESTWQESYCAFGVASEKSGEYTVVNHYGADGRRIDSVQTLPDGSRYVTTYRYGDVYIYTP
ncbi:MAG: hypothetical protein IJH48_01000 [Oscillospiraceae bacterium]|nr:hypothetical protein [Oscillospiraceae bacterium]